MSLVTHARSVSRVDVALEIPEGDGTIDDPKIGSCNPSDRGLSHHWLLYTTTLCGDAASQQLLDERVLGSVRYFESRPLPLSLASRTASGLP